MTELQKVQVAYAHFTLEQWKALAALVAFSDLADSDKRELLTKMPSAAHPEQPY